MSERRSCPRVKTSRPAFYLHDIYPRPKACSTVDISLGGSRIETLYSLEPGESLEISIAIRPWVIKCRGKVVHILRLTGERLQAGVAFEEMSKQDRLYLREHISLLLEQRNQLQSLTVSELFRINIDSFLYHDKKEPT